MQKKKEVIKKSQPIRCQMTTINVSFHICVKTTSHISWSQDNKEKKQKIRKQELNKQD